MDLDRSRRLVRLRSNGHCEACGEAGQMLDPHHRQARGAGGVSGFAAEVANDVRNLLALCRTCHDMTEDADEWFVCITRGWRIPHYVNDPRPVPALLWTVNGIGWWYLTADAGYARLDWHRAQVLTRDMLAEASWGSVPYTPPDLWTGLDHPLTVKSLEV